jgi:MazG family protein
MSREGLTTPWPGVYNAVATPGLFMAEAAGALFESLLAIMSRLRGDGGCPWDREQTRESLKPYLIEEAYEVLQAVDESDRDHLVEELGDLLFQVVFHCQIARERSEFTMADVLQRLCDKMVRRHPHVFGERPVADAREALSQWERIKSAEVSADGKPRSTLDGVPNTLPALLRAQRLQVKAARLGFDWPNWQGAWAKVREETAEMEDALGSGDGTRIREELGDLLFSVVNVARLLDIDAEDMLRRAAMKFTSRFREVEAEMVAAGRTVREASAEELDRAWEAAKAQESARSDASRSPR